MEKVLTKKKNHYKHLDSKGNDKLLNVIKKSSITTLVLDFILISFYLAMVIYLFVIIKKPGSTTEVAELTYQEYYVFLGRGITIWTINKLITMFILFLIVGFSTFVVNVKRQMSLDYYDYHRWEAGNYLVKGLLCLLYLNIPGFLIRIVIAELLMRFSEGLSLIGFLKVYHNDKKEKRKQEYERKHNKNYYKEQIEDDLKQAEIKYSQALEEARNAREKELLKEQYLEYQKQKAEELKNEDKVLLEQKQIKQQLRSQTAIKITKGFLVYLFLIIMAVFVLIPFYWMILTALKTHDQARAEVPEFFLHAKDLQWINLKFVLQHMRFGHYIRNTLIVAVISTLGTLITTILAAFAFSKINFKGRDTLFSILLLTMMIPGEIYSITNFLTVSSGGLGWVGAKTSTAVSYFAAMIVPFMTSVFYIFFLRQTFKQVPDALYHAAKIDGCSDFKFLRRVMIPIAGPTIFTITILSILGTWSAYVWPNLITSVDPSVGKNYWLIAVALRETSFVQEFGGDSIPMFNLQIAASAIVTIPLLIVFLLLRRYIIKGVGRSGTKG